MARVEVEKSVDCFGVSVVLVRKKKGKLNRREVYEAMQQEGLFGNYLSDFNIHEYSPEELYDDGDSWGLYEPNDLLGEKGEEQYNKGYDDCMKVQAPEGEWVGPRQGNKTCNCCGAAAPKSPYSTEKWYSFICPWCGARMKNGEKPK